ncbi:MAG: DNA repair protein RecO [Syntrophales bacterium]|nr:DNA repair protein RecO [Syntrophales bacterium]
MREHRKTEAVVMQRLNYGESDLIITFYTKDYGKLRGIAKGAKRSRKRFANALDNFCRSLLYFSRKMGEDLVIVENCDVIQHFEKLRISVVKTTVAAYFTELVDAFTPEGKPQRTIYSELCGFLSLLEENIPPSNLSLFFGTRLLKLTGFQPVLDHCTQCKLPLSKGVRYTFAKEGGGIVCDRCYFGEQMGLPVSLGTIKTLNLAMRVPLTKLRHIQLSQEIAEEAKNVLKSFIFHLTGKELKSLKVLEQIHSWEHTRQINH